jgi:hypothetical protein
MSSKLSSKQTSATPGSCPWQGGSSRHTIRALPHELGLLPERQGAAGGDYVFPRLPMYDVWYIKLINKKEHSRLWHARLTHATAEARVALLFSAVTSQ